MRDIGSDSKNPLTVVALTQAVKLQLEQRFPRVWVVGEISNFKAASSGHWYFSLKDDRSQVRVNMWRSANATVGFRPRDGMEVLVSGSLNVYLPRGEYSLVVDRMEELGLGRLRAEFERLKRDLKERGWFDQTHKRPLPMLPRKIGIVTSPTGAAIRDMLRVLHDRFANLEVLLMPVRVQGELAGEEIAAGIRTLDRLGGCDLLIVGRGGGSVEDLWAFNEEVVAAAIFESTTPIISAVGHETDTTIADFVADVRAATPSNGAELAIRTKAEFRRMARIQQQNLERAIQRRLLKLRHRVKNAETHPIFVRVRSRVNDLQRKLAELDYRRQRSLEQRLNRLKFRLQRADQAIQIHRISARAGMLSQRLSAARSALHDRTAILIERSQRNMRALVCRLEDLSPMKILGRGYSVVFDGKDRIVRDPKGVKPGELIHVRMAEGRLRARVIEDETKAVQSTLF